MTGLLARLTGQAGSRRAGRRRQPAGGSAYRSTSCPPLLPAQIRNRHFSRTRLGHRGLDPDEVQAFLDRVAAELAAAHDTIERSRTETSRIKDALRRWQSQQARTRNNYAGHLR